MLGWEAIFLQDEDLLLAYVREKRKQKYVLEVVVESPRLRRSRTSPSSLRSVSAARSRTPSSVRSRSVRSVTPSSLRSRAPSSVVGSSVRAPSSLAGSSVAAGSSIALDRSRGSGSPSSLPKLSVPESPLPASTYKLPEISSESVAELPFLRRAGAPREGDSLAALAASIPPSPGSRLPPLTPSSASRVGGSSVAQAASSVMATSLPPLTPSPAARTASSLPPLTPSRAGSSLPPLTPRSAAAASLPLSPSSLPPLPASPRGGSSIAVLPPLTPRSAAASSLPPLSQENLLPPLSPSPSSVAASSIPNMPSSPLPQSKKLPTLSRLSALK